MRKLTQLLMLFFVSLVVCACHNNKPAKQAITQPAAMQPVVKPVESQPLPKDTIMQAVQYDSSETIKVNLDAGWIDYFNVDGNLFRVRYDSITGAMVAEYNKAGKWHKNTSFEMRDDFEVDDCNHDGFADLYSNYGNQIFANYYLPAKKRFSKQYVRPGDGEDVLDSAAGLYVVSSQPWHICNDYISQLVDYKKSVPNIHFILAGETYRIDGNCIIDSIRMIHLYKYDEAKDNAVLLKSFPPASPKVFDDMTFWQKHYKELMGIK